MAISAWYGLNGSVLGWEGMVVYPPAFDTFGNDVIQGHARAHLGGPRDGLTVSLVDAWVLDPKVWRELNAVSWVPVDHDPVPPRVLAFLHDSGAVPMAMSRHGERLLREEGLDPLYCPHAVDTDALAPMDRGAARQMTGLPSSAFVVGMVAANKGYPSRKSFPEAIEAFAALHARHDDALLYLHTEALGQSDGVHLPGLLVQHKIPREAVRFCDQYSLMCRPAGPEHMRAVYNSMDVLLNPSTGEGFGVPIVEAQACGTPVIVTDFTAMSELCGSGWLVTGQRSWTYQQSFQMIPDVEQIVSALESAYTLAGGMRDEARAFAENYDVRPVMDDFMLPALHEAAKRHEVRANAAEASEPVAA